MFCQVTFLDANEVSYLCLFSRPIDLRHDVFKLHKSNRINQLYTYIYIYIYINLFIITNHLCSPIHSEALIKRRGVIYIGRKLRMLVKLDRDIYIPWLTSPVGPVCWRRQVSLRSSTNSWLSVCVCMKIHIQCSNASMCNVWGHIARTHRPRYLLLHVPGMCVSLCRKYPPSVCCFGSQPHCVWYEPD